MGLFSFRRKQETAGDDSVFSAPLARQPAAQSVEQAAPRSRSRSKGGASEPVDPVLPEKQRARRRLVGALALVLAAVIGLPMILDPEPKPVAADIAIEIPSRDKPRPGAAARAADVPASASLDKREEIVPGTEAAPAAAVASKAVPAAESLAKPGAPALPGAQPKGEPAARDEANLPKAAADKPEARPDANLKKPGTAGAAANTAANNAPNTAANTTTATRPADEARARALLDGKGEAGDKQKTVTDSDKAERYMVQVAAFASPEKVRELQNKLKAAGIKSTTQKVATETGERIRVRVGPVQGRAEAEKVRARLTKMGLNGTLVRA
jgi:DedD protein